MLNYNSYFNLFSRLISLIVSKRRSKLLLRPPPWKRATIEKKEVISNIEIDEYIKEDLCLSEFNDLDSKIKEYKTIQIWDAKYREIVSNLIERSN